MSSIAGQAVLKRFILSYLDELRTCVGQFPTEHWDAFPNFFYKPYTVRAQICSNGVAILFRRPAGKQSVIVENSKKQCEEAFLPYLPYPPYYAVFGWTNATRVKHIENRIINWDWSRDPAKGKKFQRPGEDFRRMSVMHLKGSNEVQMIDCHLSGVSDEGRLRRFIPFLWMLTEDCVELTEEKARGYAREDFQDRLNLILFVRDPRELSESIKRLITEMLWGLKRRFSELVSRTDVEEQEIQDFLEDHRFIIDPSALRVWAKQALGKHDEADFILGYEDSIRVVEIKRPFDEVFVNRMRLSSVTKQALSELRRYQGWLLSNESVAIGRYGSEVLRRGWAIIGRATEMSKEELEVMQSWNLSNNAFELKTYDDLLGNFDYRIRQLGNQSPASETAGVPVPERKQA